MDDDITKGRRNRRKRETPRERRQDRDAHLAPTAKRQGEQMASDARWRNSTYANYFHIWRGYRESGKIIIDQGRLDAEGDTAWHADDRSLSRRLWSGRRKGRCRPCGTCGLEGRCRPGRASRASRTSGPAGVAGTARACWSHRLGAGRAVELHGNELRRRM